MKDYTVRVPFAGYIEIAVEAENEEQAKQIAMKKADEINFEREPLLAYSTGNNEWAFMEKLTEGNYSYLPLNEIEVVEF